MQTTPLRTSDQRTLLLYIHLNWRVSRILLSKKKSFRITKLYSGFYCRFAPYVNFYLFIIFFWPIISPLCRTRKNFGASNCCAALKIMIFRRTCYFNFVNTLLCYTKSSTIVQWNSNSLPPKFVRQPNTTRCSTMELNVRNVRFSSK